MDCGFDIKQMVFYNMAFNKNNAWFCHVYYNALCRLDLESNEIVIESLFPAEDSVFGKYGNILYFEEKLILSPRNSVKILIYDLKSKDYTEINLSKNYKCEDININLFTNAFIYKNEAFFIPGTYKAIVKMDLKTLELTYYDDWYENLESDIKSKQRVLFLTSYQEENYILLPFCRGNKILKFSLNDGNSRIIEVPDKSLELMDIICEENIYWLADRNKKSIYQWDIETNHLIEINNYPRNYQTRSCDGIHSFKKYNDDIYIFPMSGNMILKYNIKDQKMTEFFKLNIESEESMKFFLFSDNNFLDYNERSKEQLYMYSILDGMIYCVDFREQTVKKIKSYIKTISDDLKRQIFISLNSAKENKNFVMQETENVRLDVFLEVVKRIK